MFDLYKELITNQYEAAFCMLASCIDQCPEENWNEPVANRNICEVLFHTLFFADIYLGPNLDALREQPFHHENSAHFADYAELEKGGVHIFYERSFINAYLQHCRDKAAEVIAAETPESLNHRPGFDWLKFSRAEVHVYNIRHIHHHAAQLSLRLRLDIGADVPWVGSSWRVG